MGVYAITFGLFVDGLQRTGFSREQREDMATVGLGHWGVAGLP